MLCEPLRKEKMPLLPIAAHHVLRSHSPDVAISIVPVSGWTPPYDQPGTAGYKLISYIDRRI
jgi:hypothetical protein